MRDFQVYSWVWWLRYLMWICHQMNISRPTNDKSILVQVMTAPSHYLSQYWPSSMSPYGVTRPQWVKCMNWGNHEIWHEVNQCKGDFFSWKFSGSLSVTALHAYIIQYYIDWLVQERRNFSALAMELCHSCTKPSIYRQVSNIRCTLEGNKIVDHSDVVGAAPVGAAPTTSSF